MPPGSGISREATGGRPTLRGAPAVRGRVTGMARHEPRRQRRGVFGVPGCPGRGDPAYSRRLRVSEEDGTDEDFRRVC